MAKQMYATGVTSENGHYEYCVMPFGLTNAPVVFQAMINDVLRDFLFLDDILIYSPDLATHQDHVNQVLKRLLEHHLYVKAVFFMPILSCSWASL